MQFFGRLIAFSFFAFCICFSSAVATDASRLSKAREVVIQLKVDEQFKSWLPKLVGAFKLVIEQSGGNDEQKRAKEAIAISLMQQRAGALIAPLAELYSQKFTEPELDDMLAFYSSPTGRKILVIQPELAEGGGAIGRQFFQSLSAEFTAILRNRGLAPSSATNK